MKIVEREILKLFGAYDEAPAHAAVGIGKVVGNKRRKVLHALVTKFDEESGAREECVDAPLPDGCQEAEDVVNLNGEVDSGTGFPEIVDRSLLHVVAPVAVGCFLLNVEKAEMDAFPGFGLRNAGERNDRCSEYEVRKAGTHRH